MNAYLVELGIVVIGADGKVRYLDGLVQTAPPLSDDAAESIPF